jgi:uncharacterized protein (DUF342 family)
VSPELGPGGLAPELDKYGLQPEPAFEENVDNRLVAVYISQDQMKAFLVLHKKEAQLELDLETLLAKIRAGGVAAGIDEGAVKRCLARASGRDRPQIMEIARGREAEDGQDGKLEFYVQPSSEEARYSKDAGGRVNYHELNLIENVQAGQEIARLLPPKPGVAGTSVLGEVLPSRTGEPAKVRAGKGVRADESGELFVAEIPGRLVHESDELSISQHYEVRGNVDYSVGNINFVGHVTVTGEILDDFNVTAQMGLEVRGPVGNCQLVSDGNVVLAGGMAGKGRGMVLAGGEVRTRYLNEVTVEAEGSVSVERESYNSVIRTAGAFVSPAGSVVGGEVTAMKGIEVSVAGSDLGVPTKLRAGIDFRRAERRRRLAEEINTVSKEVERISTAIGPLLGDPGKLHGLPTDKKKAVLGLVGHLKKLKARHEELLAQRMGRAEAASQEALRQVNVKDKAYAGVSAELGGFRLVLRQETAGPLTMIDDPASQSVRLVSYSELGKVEEESEEQPGGEPPAEGAEGREEPPSRGE